MEDRFTQQLKKGILEMLVLMLVCREPTYGYALQNQLKELSHGRFVLKEGTLYPILYRLEDEGLIAARWSQGQGRIAPKKLYEATDKGKEENIRRHQLWQEFQTTVNSFLKEALRNHDTGREKNEALYTRGRTAIESAERGPVQSHE